MPLIARNWRLTSGQTSTAVPVPRIHNEKVLPGFATAHIFVVLPIIVLRISHDSLLHVQPTTELTAVLHNWFDCSVMEPKKAGSMGRAANAHARVASGE